MKLSDTVRMSEGVLGAARCRQGLEEEMALGRAHLRIIHSTPTNWIPDPETGLLVPDPESYRVLSEDEAWNLITNVGRIFLHTQGYGTSGLGANGLNYIALSNDTVTETATSTTLSNEIATNGLSRAQGTVVLPSGSGNQTTVDHTFTATGTQSAQKAALFTASSSGTMNHVLGFTQRSLSTGDTLEVTFTITLG
jgi:hypothetical protein